jgi:hypothetical protein
VILSSQAILQERVIWVGLAYLSGWHCQQMCHPAPEKKLFPKLLLMEAALLFQVLQIINLLSSILSDFTN